MCDYLWAAFPDRPQRELDAPPLLSFYAGAIAHSTEMTALSLPAQPLHLTVRLWKAWALPFMSGGIHVYV